MKEEKNIKISLLLNSVIVLLTILASIIMFTGFKFMRETEPVLELTRLGMLKFFTVESNLFMGVVALLFVIEERNIQKKKTKEIRASMYITKLVSTTAVGLTFFVVFAYLGPISKDGILSLLKNSNLFFHLMIPGLSMITFICFEKTDKISFRHTALTILPTILYGFYYLINVLIHMENGKVSPIYDWYWFVQYGVWTSIIVIPTILFITYIIGIILWGLNRKKFKKEKIRN